ncbi:GRF1-interacting factor 3, partial [Mucuna pruriens]
YLDENKKLILEIMENKHLQKLAECAERQERLQQNLMYLATIADWQEPQTSAMPPPTKTQPVYYMQPQYYMQHPQAEAMAQQQGILPPNMPLHFGNPQQQLHQEWINKDMYPIPMHSEAAHVGVSSGDPPLTAGSNDALGGSMQGASEGGDGQGNSSAVHNISDILWPYLKD